MSLERQVAILGAAGRLGHALQVEFPHALLFDFNTAENHRIRPIDITQRESVFDALQQLRKRDYVINAAAYTNVDGAEQEENRERSRKINADGPVVLEQLMKARGIRVVHVSTAYVFDGTKAPYSEEDWPNPINEYGRQKWWGEEAIHTRHRLDRMNLGIVLRTDMLYGPHGAPNVVDKMVHSIRTTGAVAGVLDQYGSPTYTGTLASITRQLMTLWEQDETLGGQIYHATSGDGCSGAELAQEIVAILGCGRVLEMTMKQYREGKSMADRPADCRLRTDKLNKLGIATSSWRSDLEPYILHHLLGEERSLPVWAQRASQTPANAL